MIELKEPYIIDFSDISGWSARGPGVHIFVKSRSEAYTIKAALNAAYITGILEVLRTETTSQVRQYHEM